MPVPYDPDVDYYAILQVHPHAHQEVIKRAYRTILGLLQAHPDLGGTHEDAVRVNEAYVVLSDPESRRTYDQARARIREDHARLTPPPPRPPDPPPQPEPAPKRHHPRPAAKHAHRAPAVKRPETRTLYCSRCGARNRLPLTADPHHAICGKCRAPLAGLHHTPLGLDVMPSALQLAPHLEHRLAQRCELHVRITAMPTHRRLQCLRCHYEWMELGPDTTPLLCPKCRSPRWNEFRLFQCRYCAHRFSTGNLLAWPYLLFTACPSCHEPRWHRGCERNPFRGLVRWFLDRIDTFWQ